jgi:hypothetical protein
MGVLIHFVTKEQRNEVWIFLFLPLLSNGELKWYLDMELIK